MVATTLERQFGFQYLRYSLELAKWYGIDPDDKSRLQMTGAGVMADGQLQRDLNQRLIAQIDATKDAAVDGLRDPIDLESLRAEFGNRFALLFVETDPRERFERVKRNGRYETYEEFLEADRQPTELKIDDLRSSATGTLSGTQTEEELTSRLRSLINELRQRILA